MKKFSNICVIQDSELDDLPKFKEIFISTKINTVRRLSENKNIVTYNIEGDLEADPKILKIHSSNTLISFFIYTLKILQKAKRALGY